VLAAEPGLLWLLMAWLRTIANQRLLYIGNPAGFHGIDGLDLRAIPHMTPGA